MAYEIYPGYITRKAAKAFADLSKITDRNELRRRIASALVQTGVDQIACDTLYMEWLWERSGSPTYFIDSPELLSFLERANFQIDVSAMAFPSRIFSIVLPTKCHFSSFLFGRMHKETHERDLREWVQWMGGPLVKHIGQYAHESWLCCAMRAFDGGHLKSYVPCALFDEALMPAWLAQHLATGSMVVPEDRDIAQQARCLSLGARLVAYMNAFPETVSRGLPNDIAERNAKNFRVSSAKTICMHEKLHSSPESHIRNAHFRTLGHRRFKRDENGHVRVVFVRSTMVGSKADTYVVSLQDPESAI